MAHWNANLEERVASQVEQLERMSHLKGFFLPQLVEAILNGGEALLKTHRREISVVCVDLRGFIAFADQAEPEEVMEILHEFHTRMGDPPTAQGIKPILIFLSVPIISFAKLIAGPTPATSGLS